jgi:glycosyltransferase involved in cell wall biosynthesis
VDVSQFTFRAQPKDYVCYLGRFTSGKGPRQAIATARELGIKIIMAGPSNPYFREHVQPLVDGRDVEYVGPVNLTQRNELLGGARALIYPIQYPEAFGLVLLEAMLCGTPVAAIRLGAVPEIVDEGVTGCCADSSAGFHDAVVRAMALDRHRVRQQAELRFSAERMALDYARIYAEIASNR